MKNFLLVVPRFARVGGFYNFPLDLIAMFGKKSLKLKTMLDYKTEKNN